MKTFLVTIGFAIALLVLCAGITFGIMLGVSKLNEPYLENCRAAGGVPVSADGGTWNCGNPNGGWIDVRR